MGRDQRHGAVLDLLALLFGKIATDIIVAKWSVGVENGLVARDIQFPGHDLADRFGIEIRIDPLGLGHALKAHPLWQVQAAMIGGQHHRIVDAFAISVPKAWPI